MTEPPVAFAAMLRDLRTRAGLTQEELAEISGMSLRALSNLERGQVTTPQKDTVRLLADALHLAGPVLRRFEAIARGRAEPDGPAATARTLPRDVTAFTGRQRELDQLAANTGGVVRIHAIGGMAGVGKTAFAVHAAHGLADRFPGGQIFLPLHGHTPGRQPVDPEDALASLLLAIGMSAGQIPPGLEARMALWRDRAARQQLLLILDDAVSSEQVDPLLPGSGSSLVLITSRRRLTALEDATLISLDALPSDEAAALLVRLTGRPGLSPSDPSVREIIRLCGYLPLAIGMVGRHLLHHPAWSLARRAEVLAAERDRLELMAAENVSVAAAFDLSYADLVPDCQRLFRRLSLHPASEFDAFAAAALDGISLTSARRELETLYDRHLLTESAHGRYQMHDLIREYARTLADRHDPLGDHHEAFARLLDYYQQAATYAQSLFAGNASILRPEAIPHLAGQEEALAWTRTERASLLACLAYVTRTGQHARIVALTAGVAGLLRRDGPWAEARRRHTAALESARHLGDRLGQAITLSNLGSVCELTGDFPAAGVAHEEALELYRDLADPIGRAQSLLGVGRTKMLAGDIPGAGAVHEEALELYRDLGDRNGQARILGALGNVWYALGDYPRAISALEEGLSVFRELSNRSGQANVLNLLGDSRRVTGNYLAAAQDLKEALTIFRDLSSRLGQSNALTSLGIVHRLTGDYPAAISDLEEALVLCLELDERLGQARALNELGVARRLTGDHQAATRNAEEALSICRDIGYRTGQANALVSLGAIRALTGDYDGSATALEEAIAIQSQTGDRESRGEALNELGSLHRARGELAKARGCHQEALELARESGSVRDEAHALAGLGRCALADSSAAAAADWLRQSLGILRHIGAAEAASVAAELDALPG
jgi:tetratricopeptide (TPR) repeat protein/transcriptional regulator with XRE-family HTH domain